MMIIFAMFECTVRRRQRSHFPDSNITEPRGISFPFGELVLRQECPVEWEGAFFVVALMLDLVAPFGQVAKVKIQEVRKEISKVLPRNSCLHLAGSLGRKSKG